MNTKIEIDNDLEKIKLILKETGPKTVLEVAKELSWPHKSKKDNQAKINIWIAAGELVKNSGGKLTLPENLNIVKGKFSIIKDKFAFVDTEEDGIFVPKSAFNGALDGDTVFVKVTKSKTDTKGKEGEVFKILKREKETVIGIFEKHEHFGFVVPTHSFGKDIFISKDKSGLAKNKDLVVVKITYWGDAEKRPEGEVIKVMGGVNSKNMIDSLVIREGVSEVFSEEAMKEVQSIVNLDVDFAKKERVDLRNLNIITIDGEDSKDLDDAVYVENLSNGNYRIIVSIADVSFFIKQDSALDIEARERGNSFYLSDRVIPMFPKEISNGVCSLNEKEDKLTFTCDIEINKQGKVINVETYKSVIKSVARMTYTDVNKILDGDKDLQEKYKDIVDMLNTMLELSLILRKKKHDRGSVDFDLPEIKLILKEDGSVDKIKSSERGESEKIIEDFMIAANEAVAEKIFWLEIPSVYRIHEKPDSDNLRDLNTLLAQFKYKIHNTDDIHPKKLQEIIADSKERGISGVVHKMILRSLKQAKYSTESLGHFGLASTYYTHFTSPIRRYSDLMIHRVLNSILSGYPTKKVISSNLNDFPKICQHISRQERIAMSVEYESVKIKLVEYMQDKIGENFNVIVTGFSNKRIFFETDEHIECSWDVVSANHFYEFDEKKYIMVDRDNPTNIFQIGDKLEVLLVRANMLELVIEVVPTKVLKEGL